MKNGNGNDLYLIITQAIEEMGAELGKNLSPEDINLAELQRRTGISRARLRRLKEKEFKPAAHGRTGTHADVTVLSGFTGSLDNLLKHGITNSSVCLEMLQKLGYSGGQTQIKEYISRHRDLVPAMKPEAILMDEPTSALDPFNRRMIINTVKDLKQTKLIASHDLDMILDTCSRVILLSGGEIAADGPADVILRDRALLEANRMELPLSLTLQV